VAVTRCWSTLIAGLAVTAACTRDVPAPVAESTGPDPLDVTRWTDRTELFAEYPALVVGETSRFAIHLTRLDGFKAVTSGVVEVHLRGGSGPAEVFRVDRPSRPGIFGVDVKPARQGNRDMVITLQSPGLTDELVVGAVSVHATAAAARSASSGQAEAEGISFLKEQQWSLEFGTAPVETQALRASFPVPARIEARPGGTADVRSPIDGRLVRVADLTIGARVARDQELARVQPPASTPGNLPELRHAQAAAASALALATRDRERAERLTTAGAAPDKRLDEARGVEAQARSRLTAAEETLAQYDNARRGSDRAVGDPFIVRAPIAGVIVSRDSASGANVTAGSLLFHVVEPTFVHVVGQVPEVDAAGLRGIASAEIEAPGRDDRVAAGRLVGIGQVIDPRARTLPITFVLDNRAAGLPVGQAVTLHLRSNVMAELPVVPVTAIVDDAGRPIVFVQTGGESFERRAVTLGTRGGEVVQITEGLKAGERVVTKGAHLVRLASLSTSVPAHGHVH
jgi:cobalt-zinc-cadmium efflux system membrane fusion protein